MVIRLRTLRTILWALLLAAQAHLAGCDPVNPEPEFEPPVVALGAQRHAPDERSLYGRLQSRNEDVRMAAILQAGREKDPQAVPYLVDRLGDGYAEVRFAAIVALEKITGTTREYRYWAPTAERRRAIEQWRQWLAGRNHDGPGGKGQ